LEYEKKQKHETKTNDGENNENHISYSKCENLNIYRSIWYGLNCTYILLSSLLLIIHENIKNAHIMITW
jgi:hypothetical protein